MTKRIAVLATLALAGCQAQLLVIDNPELGRFGVKCTLANDYGHWRLDPPGQTWVIVKGDMRVDCAKPGLASWHGVLHAPYTGGVTMTVVRDLRTPAGE